MRLRDWKRDFGAVLAARLAITNRSQHRSVSRVLTSVARLLAYATISFSTPALAPVVARAQGAAADSGVPAQSIATSFPQNSDADGRRKVLAARGITYGLNYVGEWQANVSGGVSRGSDYIGRLEGLVDVDLGKIAGWQGLMFHVNGYQI